MIQQFIMGVYNLTKGLPIIIQIELCFFIILTFLEIDYRLKFV